VGGRLAAKGRGALANFSCGAAGAPVYAGGMNIVHLTNEELEMARHGMTAYLHSFGHDEADIHVVIRAVLARLAAAQPEQDPSAALD
jgi:hypothetical protein